MLKKKVLSVAVLLCLSSTASLAQTEGGDETELDRVVVTGIRGSLQSSMNLKRDSVGVMDGIIAEDIGKFPDTNLAESLQRISGVSIDRTESGEGRRVTVRGIANFNLVLLNNRQMPAANIPPNGAGLDGSRAFDFSNLASDAISEMQVFKSARANIATGGIGATINVRTARPLDNPGFRASIGAKGMMDRSVDNMPSQYPGDKITPEVSGIFSNTFLDGRFGIAASASYQSRDSGYNQIRTNRWDFFKGDDSTSRDRLPLETEPAFSNDYNITNRPGPDDIYGRPNSFGYLVGSEQRQRRNAQLTAQFAPTDAITATVDYTYADNRMQRWRDELLVRLQHSAGASTWTDGPIAAPTHYTEYYPAGRGDNTTNSSHLALRSELKSAGFNLEWKVSDNLDLALDYHSSNAEIGADSPRGSAYTLSTTTRTGGDVSIDFTKEFPTLTIGGIPTAPENAVLGLSLFRNAYSRSEVDQFQASGTFRFAEYQALDFGVATTEVYNRAADSDNSVFTRLGTPADYDSSIWTTDHLGRYFDRFSGHDDPALVDNFLIADLERLLARSIELGGEARFSPRASFTNDIRTTEKSRSAYLQWRNTFDWVIPVNVSAGVRYEKTEVYSIAQVFPPQGNIQWIDDASFLMTPGTTPVNVAGTGEYDYWLPSMDIRADLRDNLILRGSWGKSIGRPGWQDIQSGVSVATRYGREGGSGNGGDPALLPVESKNIDLSLEWYYGEGSYASIGYFRKNVKNVVGFVNELRSPFPDIRSPLEGVYYMDAVTLGGCGINALDCIYNDILTRHAGAPGVDTINKRISGQPGDPSAQFDIRIPVNQSADTIDGWEISVQHLFGNSGFGVSANYTKVDSGLKYDNTSLDAQYPMVGLSDSANLVLFYEKFGWQVRAAYNWRDEFLSSTGGTGTVASNPYYTESYGQLDMNVTYDVNENLSVFVEGINLTDETQRRWVRHPLMIGDASQTGPRYMFGLRYRF